MILNVLMNMNDYIIGMDIAKEDSKDFSCLTMMCSNCKHIVHWEWFTGEQPKEEIPKICPHCNSEFKNGSIIK
jgi:DNA-directed RNA polymerase subunit RPC12/RpoP